MVSLSNAASSDIDSILDYSIINFGERVTFDYHYSLEKCFETLDTNPLLGMEVEHIHADYLCFEHRSHLIFYKTNKDGVLIVRVFHKSMDAQKHFS